MLFTVHIYPESWNSLLSFFCLLDSLIGSYAATAQCFSLARLHAVILEPQHRTLNGTRNPRACHHCAQVRNEAASLAEAGVPGDIVSNHCLLTAFWFWNKEEIHQSWSIIHILVSRQVNRAHGHGQPTVPARVIYHNFTLSPLFTWCWQNQDKSVLWNLCWTEKTRSQKRKKLVTLQKLDWNEC